MGTSRLLSLLIETRYLFSMHILMLHLWGGCRRKDKKGLVGEHPTEGKMQISAFKFKRDVVRESNGRVRRDVNHLS